MNSNVLIITNKEDITVDFVISIFKKNKINYYRLNTEELSKSISVIFNGFDFLIKDLQKKTEFFLSNFTSVYFRRPGTVEINSKTTFSEKVHLSREYDSILEGMYRFLENKYWLNSVFDIRKLENKPYQLLLARNLGFNIIPSSITNDPDECSRFLEKHPESIFKPIKTGFIEGYNDEKGRILYTTKVDDTFKSSLSSLKGTPVYLQKEIKKEYDVRVTVIGNEVFAANISSQNKEESKTDWRKSEDIPKHEVCDLPNEIKEKCLELNKMFNLGFSAIDLIFDKNGKYWFLEINPNGQWVWVELLLNFPLGDSIVKLLNR